MNATSKMLGSEKINKLLLKLSLPAMMGLIVSALYNIIDTIFLGKGVGTLAIGALTIASPIQSFIMAIAVLFGMGAATAISRYLGANDVEKAEYVLGNAILSIVVVSSFISLFGLVFLEPLLLFFGETDTILPYAKEYMSIILLGSMFFSFAMAMNNVIRAEGNAKNAMVVMMLGAGLNIILDPIFIFGFDMGIRGAALATVIA